MNTKFRASCKHLDGQLVVNLNIDECTVDWTFLSKNEPVNYGSVEMELYNDNTWLAYWETHNPMPRIPNKLKSKLEKLFKKIGMRDDEDF